MINIFLARLEKNYFDENFGKFFRTEQMIFSIEAIVDQEAGTEPLTVDDLIYDFKGDYNVSKFVIKYVVVS